jgi:hypothetical protein
MSDNGAFKLEMEKVTEESIKEKKSRICPLSTHPFQSREHLLVAPRLEDA